MTLNDEFRNMTGSTSIMQPDFLVLNLVSDSNSSSASLDRRSGLFQEVEGFWRENTDGSSENFETPVTFDTYMSAKKFIGMLPIDSLPNEAVPVSLRGHIGFDWNNPDGRSLTVVVGDDTIYFAALLNNGQRVKGSFNLPITKIPASITDAIISTFE